MESSAYACKFILDTKGELVATCARACQAAGQKVNVLDPFDVLSTLSIPRDRINVVGVNPLAAIDYNNESARDRLVASLAATLCSSEFAINSEASAHFSDNAKIIIEGSLDYYIDAFRQKPAELNLVAFHDWWMDLTGEGQKAILEQMRNSTIKAQAAAAQMSAAGKEESGSMKTTVYRHIKWLRSFGIRQLFGQTGMDAQGFAEKNVDIFLVFPEDMIPLYGQLMRMILGLLKVQIIQTPVAKLKPDYLLVLDELGQFPYASDVEQAVNAMRYRHVKVHAIFQTYGQVEKYQDKSVFKGMEVKKFLGGDDIPTMQWIATLGDKQTVLTENISRNTSTTAKGGASSASESVSVGETSTNLIQLRDVREMPRDEQLIFIHGKRPIRCEKTYYFKDKAYVGRFDPNPYEQQRQ